MYVSRRAGINHGTYQFHLMLFNVLVGLALVLSMPNARDYAVIFFSSGLLYSLIEFLMEVRGIRRTTVHVYGRKLSTLAAATMRGFTEGPCCCLAGLWFADFAMKGQIGIGLAGVTLFGAVYSAYSAFMDRLDLQRLPVEQRGVVGRREMSAPKLVVIVPLITALSLSGLFLMPTPARWHGFHYLFGSFYFVQVFFLINGLAGVRLIELRDRDTGVYSKAPTGFGIIAFSYDALFEMAFLFVAFYLIPFYAGWLSL